MWDPAFCCSELKRCADALPTRQPLAYPSLGTLRYKKPPRRPRVRVTGFREDRHPVAMTRAPLSVLSAPGLFVIALCMIVFNTGGQAAPAEPWRAHGASDLTDVIRQIDAGLPVSLLIDERHGASRVLDSIVIGDARCQVIDKSIRVRWFAKGSETKYRGAMAFGPNDRHAVMPWSVARSLPLGTWGVVHGASHTLVPAAALRDDRWPKPQEVPALSIVSVHRRPRFCVCGCNQRVKTGPRLVLVSVCAQPSVRHVVNHLARIVGLEVGKRRLQTALGIFYSSACSNERRESAKHHPWRAVIAV